MSGKLKATRAAHRSVITKFLKKFDSLQTEEVIDTEEISSILDVIIEKRRILETFNEKIVEQLEEEDLEAEINETDEYTFNIDRKIKAIKKLLEPKTPVSRTSQLNPMAEKFQMPDIQPTTAQSYDHTHSDECQSYVQLPTNGVLPEYRSFSSIGSQINKLPKLELPKFSGNLLEWRPFWDSFSSAVHYNPSLSDAQKFNYLKSLLFNEALQTVTGFALTNANYNKAISLLHERFGQDHKITHAHMQSLLDIPAPTHTIHSLRKFYDTTETLIRGLESLGQDQDTFGGLLIPVILNKLPSEVRRNLARENGSNNWKLGKLRESIHRELNIMEAGELTEIHSDNVPYTATFLTKTKITKNKQNTKPCVFCKEIHAPVHCMNCPDVEARIKIVKRDKLCFNCLGKHRLSECKSKYDCRNCKQRHHSSICRNCDETQSFNKQHQNVNGKNTAKNEHNVKTNDNTNNYQNTAKASMMHTSTELHSPVLLKTAVAPVSYRNTSIESNILFDEGAQRSFITQELADKLKMTRNKTETINISGFGQTGEKIRHLEKGTIYIETHTSNKIPIEVLIVPTIAAPLQSFTEHIRNYPYITKLKLAHPISNEETFDISVLIGADHYWDIVQNRVIRGNGPTAVQSKIGYLLSGPLTSTKSNLRNQTQASMMNIMISHKQEEYDLEKFWDLEAIGITPQKEESESDNYLKEYMSRNIQTHDGKYVAKLPWKQNSDLLPTNYNTALRRTQTVIRTLSKDPQKLKHYADIIKEQEQRNFIERVEDQPTIGKIVHYIPHHPVHKDSVTTPIRIVYDCSCRQSPDELSLNDCLRNDPPILNDITTILLRFRSRRYAVTTDIEKAFLQICLDENDRDATRFFWLQDPSDPTSKLVTYRFKSLLFGATCSPFILSATLFKHLEENQNKFTKMIENDLYVDNIISSFDSEKELIEYFHSSRSLMSNGNFNLRSWASNSESLRQLATENSIIDKDHPVKVLGLRWNPEEDTIGFAMNTYRDTEKVLLTKREVLRESSKIFDPLGILSPITVRCKILMQTIWKSKVDWDEVLPPHIKSQWLELYNDLQDSTKIKLQRYYFETSNRQENDIIPTLHVFVDASKSAYGACAYICNGDSTQLAMARNRVAPLKEMTIPKLELLAALIGARMSKHIMNGLEFSEVTYWSDSQIVLNWLSSSKNLKSYIARKVDEIKDLTRGYIWKYCPTKENPADMLLRGSSVNQLESSIWMNGPKWLTDEKLWPKWEKNDSVTLTTIEHEIENTESSRSTNTISESNEFIDLERFSSYAKLLRVTSYVLRFVANCKSKKEGTRKNGIISAEEMNNAMKTWIRIVQTQEYEDVIEKLNSKSNHHLIRQLRLFVDNYGLIRCGGRIHNAPLPYDARFPYLIPAKHRFTTLLVQDIHSRNLHGGKGITITAIRQQFWIPSIRQVVGNILRKCVICKKVTGNAYSAPDPPPLPKDRVSDTEPFSITGVDFTGALNVRNNGQIEKCYICLFTCANTRAVHLEIVPDLTEDSFLLCFRRFISRKSLPKTMISDNGSTFTAAAENIQHLTKSESLHNSLTEYGTTWKFIPKRAPWYGGFWERLIGLTKNCLRKVLGKTLVSYYQLVTIVTEIEAILNDRPLTYIDSEIDNLSPLTPSHLLYGRLIKSVPFTGEHLDNDVSKINNNKLCEKFNRNFERKRILIQNFWKRWRQDYLTSLREHHRICGKNNQSIQKGDIVQIHDDIPRILWKLAEVIDLQYGHDNLVRSAKIRTARGITNRPITKLYPLELHGVEETDINNFDNIQERLAKCKARENIRKLANQ